MVFLMLAVEAGRSVLNVAGISARPMMRKSGYPRPLPRSGSVATARTTSAVQCSRSAAAGTWGRMVMRAASIRH